MSRWDERYLGEIYAFGTEPNAFIHEIRRHLPASGKALDLGAGEGRNAVFLAECGLSVEGVDLSSVGLQKAAKLAAERGVSLELRQADLLAFEPAPQTYDAIISVFCHFAEPDRSRVLQNAVSALKSGGIFAGVFYAPEQLQFKTGGPSDPAMLGNLAELQTALSGLEWIVAEARTQELHEGERHNGMSAVLCLLGRKL